jgi:hypothetical protein
MRATNMALLTELAARAKSWKSGGIITNTYTQIYIQVAFALQERQKLIRSERKEELHK